MKLHSDGHVWLAALINVGAPFEMHLTETTPA